MKKNKQTKNNKKFKIKEYKALWRHKTQYIFRSQMQG